ncbi:hypothetical protein Hdeb2414_s0014g00435131 [Helianthus debilis subsp. tardiflorus]
MSAGSGQSGRGDFSSGSGSSEKEVEVKEEVNAFQDLYPKAVVGRTKDLDTLVSFDRLLRIGKVQFVKIQYLGGLSILVSFACSEEAESFLKNKGLGGSSGSGSSEKEVEVKEEVNAFQDLYPKAVVGRTKDLDTLVSFDRLLRIGKVQFVKIQYLGGLLILVSFTCSEEAESFLKNKGLGGHGFRIWTYGKVWC